MQCTCQAKKNQKTVLETDSQQCVSNQNGKMTTAVSHHVGLFHKFDAKALTFFALEHVVSSEHGGNLNRSLQLKTKWIFNLPGGMIMSDF